MKYYTLLMIGMTAAVCGSIAMAQKANNTQVQPEEISPVRGINQPPERNQSQ